jgi:hypothetical protein
MLSYEKIFATVGQVVGHEVEVVYESEEKARGVEKQMAEAGNAFVARAVGLKRLVGFGGFELEKSDGSLFPEVRPMDWESIVRTFVK